MPTDCSGKPAGKVWKYFYVADSKFPNLLVARFIRHSVLYSFAIARLGHIRILWLTVNWYNFCLWRIEKNRVGLGRLEFSLGKLPKYPAGRPWKKLPLI